MHYEMQVEFQKKQGQSSKGREFIDLDSIYSLT